MPTALPSNNEAAAERRRRNVKLVIWLGAIAALFYFGFIALHWHGRT